MDRKKIDDILTSGTVFYMANLGLLTVRKDIADFLNRSTKRIRRYKSPDDLKGFMEPVVILWAGFESYGPEKIEKMAHIVSIYDGVLLNSVMQDVTKKILRVYRHKPEEVIIRKLLREENSLSRFVNMYKCWKISLDPLTKRTGSEAKAFYIYIYMEEGENLYFRGVLGACSKVSFYSDGSFRQQDFLDCREEGECE